MDRHDLIANRIATIERLLPRLIELAGMTTLAGDIVVEWRADEASHSATL